MEKNVAFFKRTEKNGTFRTEKNAVPNPAYVHTAESNFSNFVIVYFGEIENTLACLL